MSRVKTDVKVKKMVTTKENNRRQVILTSDLYDDSLDYFLDLLEIAKQDFPEIEIANKNVKIKKYGGDTHKGLMGIEFDVILETIPDGYEEVSDYIVCKMYPTC